MSISLWSEKLAQSCAIMSNPTIGRMIDRWQLAHARSRLRNCCKEKDRLMRRAREGRNMTSDLAVPLQDTNTVQIVRNLDHLDALDNLVKSHLALVTYLESKIERRQSGLQSGPGKAVKSNIIRSDLLQVKGILKSDQSRAACAEGGVSHQESSSRKVTFHHEVRKIQSSSSFVDTELWDDPGDYLTWKRNVNLGEEAGAMSSIASFSETSGSKESIYFDAESEGISDGDDGTDTELA